MANRIYKFKCIKSIYNLSTNLPVIEKGKYYYSESNGNSWFRFFIGINQRFNLQIYNPNKEYYLPTYMKQIFNYGK